MFLPPKTQLSVIRCCVFSLSEVMVISPCWGLQELCRWFSFVPAVKVIVLRFAVRGLGSRILSEMKINIFLLLLFCLRDCCVHYSAMFMSSRIMSNSGIWLRTNIKIAVMLWLNLKIFLCETLIVWQES